MRQLESAFGNQDQHYANLSRYSRDGLPAESMNGMYWQIDEAIYDYFLSVLPPIYVSGGFALCEFLTGNITGHYWKIGPHYWCGYCAVRTNDATVMKALIAKNLQI